MDNGDRIKLHEDVASLKTEMGFVRKQVSNHIPSAIERIDVRLDKIDNKLAYYAGGIAVLLAGIEIVFNIIG